MLCLLILSRKKILLQKMLRGLYSPAFTSAFIISSTKLFFIYTRSIWNFFEICLFLFFFFLFLCYFFIQILFIRISRLKKYWKLRISYESSLQKIWSFPLRISSVTVTKSAVSCRFGHIYWRNPSWKTSFFVQCISCWGLPWVIQSFNIVTI